MAGNDITCAINTPTEQTAYAFGLESGDLLIEAHMDSSHVVLRLDRHVVAILAAFLKHPVVAEQLLDSNLHSLGLSAPQLDKTIHMPLHLFADLYPEE